MQISLTKERFIDLARRHSVVPIATEVLGDRETPVSVFEALVADGDGCDSRQVGRVDDMDHVQAAVGDPAPGQARVLRGDDQGGRGGKPAVLEQGGRRRHLGASVQSSSQARA